MKQIPLLIALTFVLSLCSLTERLTGKKTDSQTGNVSSSASSDTGGEPVEKPAPTAAQTAALAGGQTVNWDQQGLSWTMPAKWKKETVETKTFSWGGGDSTFMSANISTMDESFPTEASIKAFYDGAKTRKKNGEVDELRWLEIDGVKGVQFREANPEKPDDIRRLQWMAYRKFAGQTQLVNLILSTTGKNFPQHQDELYAILYSTKIVH